MLAFSGVVGLVLVITFIKIHRNMLQILGRSTANFRGKHCQFFVEVRGIFLLLREVLNYFGVGDGARWVPSIPLFHGELCGVTMSLFGE